MRIVHVIPSYLPATRYGGPVYAVHGLCRALARQGHDVSVFTTNIDGDGESSVPLETPVSLDGVHVHYFRTTRWRRIVWCPRLLSGLSATLGPSTVLHLHSVFTFPTTAVARLATFRRVPYVVSPRGALIRRFIRQRNPFAKKLWLTALDKRTLARAGCVHVTSRAELSELEALPLPVAATVVVPNGVDVPPLEPAQRPLSADAPYALFLGRISWVKGLDRVMRALAHTEARLLIAGHDDEGLRGELLRLATHSGAAQRVEFIGPVAGLEKWQLIRHARFLVLPSYSENFGNVVLEAMAVDCPVIVTPEVGAAEIVREARAGIISEGTPSALGSAMERLWTQEAERLRLGRAGGRYVSAHLSWDAVAARFAAIYATLLDRAG